MGAETAQRKSQIDYSLKMLPMTCILKELKNRDCMHKFVMVYLGVTEGGVWGR